MPQFDFYTFSVQIFWTILSFFTLYFVLLKFLLARVSETLKFRKKLLLLSTQKKNSNNLVIKNFKNLVPYITIFFKK